MASIVSRSMRKIKQLWERLSSRDRQGAKNSPLPGSRGSTVRGAVLRLLRFSRRRYLLPRAARPVHPRILLLCTVSLICLCAILAWWTGQRRAESADFDLHAEYSCSNLDNTSADKPAPRTETPPEPKVQSVQPEKIVEPPALLAVPPPAPVVQVVQTEEPAVTLPPPPLTSQQQEPLRLPDAVAANPVPQPAPMDFDVSDPLEDWHRGDVPMIRNWQQILGYPALIAALFAAPVVADETASKSKSTDSLSTSDTKSIKEQLDRIENKLGSIDTLKSDVGGLKKELELMRQPNSGAFGDLDRRIGELERKLKGLETQLSQAQTRVSNFPQTNGATPATGRIRLANGFGSPARVILNNVVYRLSPFEMREVTLPVGPYTFEVLVDGFGSIQPPAGGLLTANVPRTIEIYAR